MAGSDSVKIVLLHHGKTLKWTKDFDPERITHYESARYRNDDKIYDYSNCMRSSVRINQPVHAEITVMNRLSTREENTWTDLWRLMCGERPQTMTDT